MSREKSEFLSSFGIAFQIFKAIADAVLGLGGTDQDLRRILTDKSLRERIAKIIVSEVRQVFKVTVDYSKSLAEMIKAGHYGWVNDAIVADHFPVQGEGQNEVEVALFHFNRNISSDDAIAEMEKAGYRPARIEELLALGASQPELQKEFPIVALGSVWQDPDGDRDVPYLFCGDAKRGLDLRWFESDWGVLYRFAAVRK
jgi:hypothetical protein